MRSIVLIGAICIVIASCGNRKALSENATNNSITIQEDKDSLEKSESSYDGDPNVSGSTEHIRTIMKSIADGDAKTLASLTKYPIERRYPLRDIKDYADMVRRFNSVFDADFRQKMKSA